MLLDTNFFLKVGLAMLCAAVLSFAITPIIKVLAKKVGAIDVPKDERRMHKIPIPRMGGLAIFIGFLVSFLVFGEMNRELQGILLGAVLLVVLSLVLILVVHPDFLRLFSGRSFSLNRARYADLPRV